MVSSSLSNALVIIRKSLIRQGFLAFEISLNAGHIIMYQ
jgi:hypothetical protein